MKSYDEITKTLLERRTKYTTEMKKKKKKLIGASVSICCLSLVAVFVINGLSNDGAIVLPLASNQSQKAEESEKNNAEGDATTEGVTQVYNSQDSTHNSNKGADKNNKPSQNNKGESSEETENATAYKNDETTKKNSKNHGESEKEIIVTETVEYEGERWLTKIEITRLPDKRIYYVGDQIDPSGMKVVAHYTNGDIVDVSNRAYIANKQVRGVSNKYRVQVEYVDNPETLDLGYTEYTIVALEPNISVSESSLSLDVGQGKKLTATTEATGCTLTWHTTDHEVVTVDENGNVTAVGEGTASVYAKISVWYYNEYCCYEKSSSYCAVTVNAGEVETVSE